MRTILSLDDDLAGELARLQRRQQRPLDAVVNDVLRRGLSVMATPSFPPRPTFTTEPLEPGECLVDSLDNVADVLAAAEHERIG